MPIDAHLPALLAFWREHDGLPPALQLEYRDNFAQAFGPRFNRLWLVVEPRRAAGYL